MSDPQCLIADCRQILAVRCCSDSCNHYKNMHRYIQVQQAGKDILSILAVFICAVEVGQVTDFNWSWCLYEHRGRNTPITGRPTMTNWFHHLLTGNVALAPHSGLILGTQHLLFERIFSGRKHSCCFVSGGCQHVAQFIKCIEIFGSTVGIGSAYSKKLKKRKFLLYYRPQSVQKYFNCLDLYA